MRNVSTIKLTGSIVKADNRKTNSGFSILTLTVAGDAKSRDGNKDIPFYQQVDVLGKYAEFMSDQLPIGAIVTVLGTLSQRRWEDPNGNKRSAVQIVADSVAPLAGQFSTITDKKDQERLAGGQNTATLLGNLTRDAELQYTPNGVALCRLSIAVNNRIKDEEVVSYFDITAWNEMAEEAANLKKGTPILVEGSITNDSYEGQDGNMRYVTGFEAFTINALRRPSAARKTHNPAEQQPNPRNFTPTQDPLDEFPAADDLPF